MDRVAGCDLLDGALSLERFDGDLRFQRCAELPSVLSHVCLIRQRKSTLGPCPNFGEYLKLKNVERRTLSPFHDLNSPLPETKSLVWNSLILYSPRICFHSRSKESHFFRDATAAATVGNVVSVGFPATVEIGGKR